MKSHPAVLRSSELDGWEIAARGGASLTFRADDVLSLIAAARVGALMRESFLELPRQGSNGRFILDRLNFWLGIHSVLYPIADESAGLPSGEGRSALVEWLRGVLPAHVKELERIVDRGLAEPLTALRNRTGESDG